jgi:hypothetical protein
LVALGFSFNNLKLESRPKPPHLVPDDETKPAYISVRFPPQNIAEKAYFETAVDDNNKGFPVNTPADKPDDIDEGKKKSDKLESPPVESRISFPSQLVFKVPENVKTIPYTLEGLLKICSECELRVAPTALPPPSLRRIAFDHIFDLIQVEQVPSLKATAERRLAGESKISSAQLIGESRGRSWLKKSGLRHLLPHADDGAIERGIADAFIAVFKPKIEEPKVNETAIELPYRLILSPNKFAVWAHSPNPVISSTTGRTELWHTRLAVRRGGKIDEEDEQLRTVRAIWARSGVSEKPFDPDDPAAWPPHANKPFRMSLDAFDRHNIVHLSSNYRTTLPPRGENYQPEPIRVERLMLSSLGAWIDVRGVWDELPPGLSVEEWKHRGTQGRDHYVKVVYAGYLFPFGHRASLIKVTERKFHPDEPGNVAYLRQRVFIIVKEPEKAFRNTRITIKEDLITREKELYIDRQMPFNRVRITTLVTPNLDLPESSDIGGKLQSAFWPRVDGKDFQFHLIVEDIEGQISELTAPLIFVGKEITDRGYTDPPLTILGIAKEYENRANEIRRKRPMHGQKVTFARSKIPGDTSFDVASITFGVQVPDEQKYNNLSSAHPRFFPVVRKAELSIPAIKLLVGNNKNGEFSYATQFLQHGFDSSKNAGEVFLQMTGAEKISLSFNQDGDKAGGLIKPNMNISGCSRKLGPIAGDIGKIVDGKFDPEDFFGSFDGINAKIFGVINLWELLNEVGLDNLDLVPRFVTELLSAVEGFLQDIEAFLGYIPAIRQAGGEIRTLADQLKIDIEKILANVQKLLRDVSDLNPQALDNRINAIESDLNTFKEHVVDLLGLLPQAGEINDGIKREVEKRLNQFKRVLDDVNEFIDDLKNFVQAIETVKEMRVKFNWQPKLKDWGLTPGEPIFDTSNGTKMLISVEARAKTDGKTKPAVDIICSLDNFKLNLIAPATFIRLHFKKLQFFASPGKKSDVNVELDDIEFVGVLAFVEALRSLIPLNGFSDPPAITVNREGIAANYSMALPSIAIGVFSLQNLSLSAGFTIPFIGDPLTVRFNFCERHEPFTLTVALFGGNGFFALTLDPHGVQILEAAFEFGASISVDFGVASGGVRVMAGIYFRMESNEAMLTGYFRMGGEVDVLGLVSVSIELYIDLSYEFSSGKCVGRATLTIEIDLFFFSKTFRIRCERKFAGSNGDPSFAQLMGPYLENGLTRNPWQEYCEAFA